MLERIKTIAIIALLLIVVIGSIFYFRAQRSSEARELELSTKQNKVYTDSIKDLKIDIAEANNKLDSSATSRLVLQQQLTNIKAKLSKYAQIRYYDDIDSDSADSIIAGSRYRYNKKNDNIK